MSDKSPTTSPITIANPPGDAATSDETKRPNPLVRAYRKVKATPPKTAIAVVGGVALVGAGAFLGRKSAPYHVEVVESTELEPVIQVVDATEDNDDTVA